MAAKIILFIYFVSIVIKFSDAECPNIITKKMWGGRQNTEVDYIIIPVENVIIEHTVTQECNTLSDCSTKINNIQHFHINTKKWQDIAYNFLIGGDGNVYEGVGWHKVGAHAYRWNTKSIGIAFMGDFSEKLPPQKALDAAKKLLECGVELGELSEHYKLLGHRQVIPTLSPGTALFQEITNWRHYSDEYHLNN